MARDINDTSDIDCNYIYIQPPSVESLSNRIIRTRPGTETKDSLATKMNYAWSEMELAKRLDFIDRVFTNHQEEDFLKKATVHLLFDLYKLK